MNNLWYSRIRKISPGHLNWAAKVRLSFEIKNFFNYNNRYAVCDVWDGEVRIIAK
jgi:hypothetical protein